MTQYLHAPAPSLSPVTASILLDRIQRHRGDMAQGFQALAIAAGLIDARHLQARLDAMLDDLDALLRELAAAIDQTRAS